MERVIHADETVQPRDILISVQALRFLAAAMVLFGHLQDTLRRGRIKGAEAVSDPTFMPWHSGVDIFFVVSGFIMFFMSAAAFGQPGAPGAFLSRRVIRVVPLYWFFTTLMITVILALPGKVVHDDLDAAHLLATYFFVPWPNADGAIQPLLSVGWTLNYEMLFYAVFAASMLLPLRAGMSVIVAAFAALVIAGWTLPLEGPIEAWTRPIILEFLFGIAIAALYRRGVRLGFVARLGLVGAGVALLIAGEASGLRGEIDRVLLWGVPAALIAAGFILGSDFPATRLNEAIRLGGDASYSLYLSHLFTLRAIGLAWPFTGISNGWAFVVVAGAGSILAAVLVYLLLEKPMLSVLRRFVLSSRPRSPARLHNA